jgi:hypothetical protein
MLFSRLEHPNSWWCDFDSIFKKVDEDEEKVLKWENEEKRTQELNAINIYRKRVGDEFEKDLTENKEKLEQANNECREIVEYIHYKIDPNIVYYMEKSGTLIDDDVKEAKEVEKETNEIIRENYFKTRTIHGNTK